MGTIEKRMTNGGERRYSARYRNNDGDSRERWFRRKSDASAFLVTVEAEKVRGTYVDRPLGCVLFEDWAAEWHEARLHLRHSSWVRDETYLRSLVLPWFGPRQLASIRPTDIRSWLAALAARGYASSTIRKAGQLVRAIFNTAVEERLLTRSPAATVPLPRVEKRPMRLLTVNDVDALADAIAPRYRHLVITAAYTGLRSGELRGLRVEDLDLLRRQLTVMQTVDETGGKLTFGPPKTSAARRRVTLPRLVVDAMSSHLAEFGPSREGLVFSSPRGCPVRKDSFRRRYWLPAVDVSVGRPCTLHDLRHTHAALLIAEHQHPKVIQERLGHASIVTTLDRYGHLMDGIDMTAASALDDAYARESVGAVTRQSPSAV